MYSITKHSKDEAQKLGVTIKPSEVKNKKIDVYSKGKKVASIGDKRYKDYGTYLREEGEAFANKRRKLYRARHAAHASKKGTPAYYALNILW